MSVFRAAVFEVVKQIPRGSVLTYKEVAKQAGYPKAYRAVGNVLNTNYDPTIPCHRVVKSNGQVGGYNRGSAAKRSKLFTEGVIVKISNLD